MPLQSIDTQRMENEERLAIMEAVAQGVIQGLNGNENRLFGNGAIRPDSFPSQNYPDWAQWKMHFYRVGRANGWTELQGLQAVPVCLIGYALDEYNAAPRELKEQVEGADAPTLAALFNHLGREMGMMQNDRLGKAEFRKLRQQPEGICPTSEKHWKDCLLGEGPKHERRVVSGEVSRGFERCTTGSSVVERKPTNIWGSIEQGR